MRVLGVDPGSWATGWGLVEGTPARPQFVDCGLLRLRGTGGLAGRLGRLQRQLDELVRRIQPSSAAVEAPFQGANARSALQLAHARGVILAVLACAGVEVTEYTPAMVKKSVVGNGRAPKEQVQWMVSRLLALSRPTGSSDASDALAVALCHVSVHGYRAAVERSTTAVLTRRNR